VASLKSDAADLAARSRAAVLELYSLDTRLTSAERRLEALHAEAQKLRAERAGLTQALHVARVDTRLSQNRLAVRLRLMYEHGTTSSLDIVMGAKSLEDALTQLDDFNKVTAADTDVLLQVRASQRRLTRLSRQLVTRERTLAATTAAAAQTVAELRQVRAEHADYVAELSRRRSLDAARIARIGAQALAADAKSQRIAAPLRNPVAAVTTPETAPALTTAAGGRTMTVTATAYDLPGHTATGLPVGWGVVAVDPSVIPLGTRIVVPGYGVAVAADTGVHGSAIDLWFPTAAQAYAWGRRTITIALD
jgi:3D (Asp-Asp-Asp) domain-containing protein